MIGAVTRVNGEPSPIDGGAGAPPPPMVADAPADGAPWSAAAIAAHGSFASPHDDAADLNVEAPAWLGATAKLIRPLCVGALMAIPTVGAASVGIAAMFSPATGLAMAEASTRFLAGIPGDIVALIGFLAGGYTVARSAEKIVGSRR